ncbi:MAG: nitroreductase family protein [Mycoplasmataceae bacterium]|nr:nitroreductase family protein [Mycoplasmataceae bacterium]
MINKLLQRASVRKYSAKPIEREKLEALKKVINASPTSMNIQSFSAIFVTDPKVRAQLRLINWGQEHVESAPLLVVFIGDNNRLQMAHEVQNEKDNSNNLSQYLIALIDATIASSQAMSAAVALGLSTCYIGGLRQQQVEVNRLLGISGRASVVLGMTFGYAATPEIVTPKVNKCYDNQYDLNKMKQELTAYNEIAKNYYKSNFSADTNYFKASVKAIKKMAPSDVILEIEKILRISK